MMNFSFSAFDPRPTATEANEAIFASGLIFGVEVTVPALAGRCTINLDPQHAGQDSGLAAIEEALEIALPEGVSGFATVRADLDAVGAMVILAMRYGGEELPQEALDRVTQVAQADKFLKGAWKASQLPTEANPWPNGDSALAAIGAAIADFKVPFTERVALMKQWLLSGEEPAGYRERVEQERSDLVRALSDGQIKSHVANGVAVVESGHRAATMVGYSLSPVVVACNPEFRLGGGEPHKKFTICQYATGHCDLKAALTELAELEHGWGGSPTIGGSPQGTSSTLSIEQVVEVVKRHLK